jgi:hypothetical protein
MTWREMVGGGLVAAGSVCGIAATAIKGGTFEALTAAGTACMGAAAARGDTQQAEGMKSDGPGAHRYQGRGGVMRYAELS